MSDFGTDSSEICCLRSVFREIACHMIENVLRQNFGPSPSQVFFPATPRSAVEQSFGSLKFKGIFEINRKPPRLQGIESVWA